MCDTNKDKPCDNEACAAPADAGPVQAQAGEVSPMQQFLRELIRNRMDSDCGCISCALKHEFLAANKNKDKAGIEAAMKTVKNAAYVFEFIEILTKGIDPTGEAVKQTGSTLTDDAKLAAATAERLGFPKMADAARKLRSFLMAMQDVFIAADKEQVEKIKAKTAATGEQPQH